MSYDVTPAPEGADPEKWAAHERGACGGYYECAFCAAIVAREKAAWADVVMSDQPHKRRLLRRDPTQTTEDARRARDGRRAKAKAARRARKAQRRRASR